MPFPRICALDVLRDLCRRVPTTQALHTKRPYLWYISPLVRTRHENQKQYEYKVSGTWYMTAVVVQVQSACFCVLDSPQCKLCRALSAPCDPRRVRVARSTATAPLGLRLTLLEPQSRSGDNPVKFQVVLSPNGTAVLKGLTALKVAVGTSVSCIRNSETSLEVEFFR